ncbi:ThuA domain-containing protein [Membranihabitans marinus]|uniref:ThuA domain-containing protein n=1 Tax=Membranihabitans marinus TaxID=1227546 RepID=UPI001F20C8AD|nr:ThuA domain-containing protein [Membranihabitans marinus]
MTTNNFFIYSVFIMIVAALHPQMAMAETEDSEFHIVFLISEDPDNYEAHKTIPRFAEELSQQPGYKTTVLLGQGERTAFYFPNLSVIKKADLVVVFCRRLALQPEQMKMIKKYLAKGKPLVGIRTANHAFSVRDEIQEGYEDYWDFVPDVLGSVNKGYGEVVHGTDVSITPTGSYHPILKDVDIDGWHSIGNVYINEVLKDGTAQILLTGKGGPLTQPIAWTRIANTGSKVFYTSLGYPKDFENPQFVQLINNAIKWAVQ